jgi:16S rRNA (guanine(966)-N(2))-methyltransferase RsmD
MRIISGSAANTILKVPKGYDVRPTPDLVRQAIFNSLGDRVVGARVLELFGGTGALSLECLSRGAASAVCVELAPRHARMIKENLRESGLPEHLFDLRLQDVLVAIPQLSKAGAQFDLIMADPPFGEKNVGKRSTSFSQKLLDSELLPGLLADDGMFVLGHTKRDSVTLTDAWTEKKLMKHGDSQMLFLLKKTPAA